MAACGAQARRPCSGFENVLPKWGAASLGLGAFHPAWRMSGNGPEGAASSKAGSPRLRRVALHPPAPTPHPPALRSSFQIPLLSQWWTPVHSLPKHLALDVGDLSPGPGSINDSMTLGHCLLFQTSDNFLTLACRLPTPRGFREHPVLDGHQHAKSNQSPGEPKALGCSPSPFSWWGSTQTLCSRGSRWTLNVEQTFP